MKYLKFFEEISTRETGDDNHRVVKNASLFTDEELFEIDDCFKDFAEKWNIEKVDIPKESGYMDQDELEQEGNQYYIGSARNAYINILAFTSENEIIEDLICNFIPQLEQFGWVLAGGTSVRSLKKYIGGVNYDIGVPGFSVEDKTTENDTDYKIINIVVTKKP